MGIENLQFLQASNPYGQYAARQNVNFKGANYGQPQQGVPNTTPQLIGIPSTSDMEKALGFINSGIDASGINPWGQTQDPRGAAFNGFTVPENNGTGELKPKFEPGERKLDFSA